MIIRTFSDEETKIIMDKYFHNISVEDKVVLAPHGLDHIWITIDEENNELVVQLNDGLGNDLATIRGFNSVKECTQYAEKVADAAGLSKDCIDGDTSDVAFEDLDEIERMDQLPNFTRKTISESIEHLRKLIPVYDFDKDRQSNIASTISAFEKMLQISANV